MLWLLVAAGLAAGPVLWMVLCPARRSEAPLGALLAAASPDPELGPRLMATIRILSEEIGARSPADGDALDRAAALIRESWERLGYTPWTQEVGGWPPIRNIEAVIEGSEPHLAAIIVGAHYDSVPGSPGADDNATGVALLLEIARALAGREPRRSIRLAAFCCEEPLSFQGMRMGSLHYARELRRRGLGVDVMISLESLGYYSDRRGSQAYPPGLALFYPRRGNFVAVVGKLTGRRHVARVARLLLAHTPLPVESAALPGWLPGVGWSDHWAFWQAGYPAVMLTDTAPFRNPHYHGAGDLPATLHPQALAALGTALPQVVLELANR